MDPFEELDRARELLKECQFAFNDIPNTRFRWLSPQGIADTYDLAWHIDQFFKHYRESDNV